MNITFAEVNQICANHQVEISDFESTTGSFEKNVFLINQQYLLRVSEYPMAQEQAKFTRVAGFNFVPKILHSGMLATGTRPIYYTILTLLPGDDFVNLYHSISLEQQEKLGKDVALFLDELEKIAGVDYDIGLYIPVIPHFSGSWREGHQQYWGILERASAELDFSPQNIQIIKNAFQFLQASKLALEFQSGPKLLHNDFHPKNIIVSEGNFTGVIDWECSQFGEADFELCHWVHWCIYPPEPEIDYRPFLRALFQASPKCTQVPNLAERLTIYQVEHEIQQMIWQGGEAGAWRIPRLEHWMTGGVHHLYQEIT